MSWVFTAANGAIATVPAPAFGEAYSDERRQFRSESDGGQVWIQDLPIEDRFFEATWAGLAIFEWGQFLRVFQASRWGAERIQIDASGDQAFGVGIAPGQVIAAGQCNPGRGLAPDQGYSPGDRVQAKTFTLSVYLDQPRSSFEQQRERYGTLSLRFRIITHLMLQAGG